MHGFHRSGSRSGGRGWDGLSQLVWPSAQLTIDPRLKRGEVRGGAANRGGGNGRSHIDEIEGRGDKVGRQNRKLTNLCDGWIWRPWSNEGNGGGGRVVRHHRLLDRCLNH